MEIIGRKIAGNAVDLKVDEIVFWITFVDNEVDHAVIVAKLTIVAWVAFEFDGFAGWQRVFYDGALN